MGEGCNNITRGMCGNHLHIHPRPAPLSVMQTSCDLSCEFWLLWGPSLLHLMHMQLSGSFFYTQCSFLSTGSD